MLLIRRAWCRIAATALLCTIAPAVSAQPLLALRIASTPNDTYAKAYFAHDMGFFRKAGLNVELTTMNNRSAISAAVAAADLIGR
jgi:ABC-type nitrate/sulfonate/bicarbonate transport system substrate-binding protein